MASFRMRSAKAGRVITRCLYKLLTPLGQILVRVPGSFYKTRTPIAMHFFFLKV